MVEFRRRADAILRRIGRGERLILTHRGKPVARLEPIDSESRPDDPFLRLEGMAGGTSLTNRQIDDLVYRG